MKKPWLEGIEVVNVNNQGSAWGGWFETIALTAIMIVASFVTQQQDPFRLGGGFPWLVLGPLLAGLRYGFVYGFVSALLILVVLGVAINLQWQAASGFPLPWGIGVVVVAMVAGEFRDMWGRRLHRLEGAFQYRAERLEEFTRNYQLLRLSHDRLEQTVANSGLSLREGIMHLQSTLGAIMGITADRIDTARILARVGEDFTIDDNDPVLRTALESGELAAVNIITENAANLSPLLAAVPVTDSTGEVHAMLLVRSMPFSARMAQASPLFRR